MSMLFTPFYIYDDKRFPFVIYVSRYFFSWFTISSRSACALNL